MTETTPVTPRSGRERAGRDAGCSDDLVDETIALVRRWVHEASLIPPSAPARNLAGVLRDERGLEFTVGFVDGVVRPEDTRVAAAALRRVAPLAPRFLPLPLRAAVRAGGLAAPLAPGLVVPIARRALRRMVQHLVVDASDDAFPQAIAAIRREGVRLNINLLGEAVLGEREADRRLEGTMRLLRRDDVDYVSIKVSGAVAPHSPWAFDETVAHVVERLAPLYEIAADAASPAFINLDMEEFHDLDTTIAVFTTLLDRERFLGLEAGIVLQAYLPDALPAMRRLQEWAAARRARGGAPVKVRLVKGANLSMERVDAELHGWPLATWPDKRSTDAHYKRVLDEALRPEHVENVRVGIAGHNLFDVAHSWLLAGRRGVRDGVDYEMLLGMAESLAEVVRRDVGSLLLYTPVVRPEEFDVAIAYLVRRLEESASDDNFMSAVFDLEERPELFEREKERFIASLEQSRETPVATFRVQDRLADAQSPVPGRTDAGPRPFENTPDTDPSTAAGRAWGRGILSRVPGSVAGDATIDGCRIGDAAALDRVLGDAADAASGWASLGARGRAEILRRAADALERRRAELIEVMASEAGKTIDQADPEVSEAIDFARYYAERAEALERIDGASFTPMSVTVVTPPWNFPVAIPAGSTLAALASGSSVVIKPARAARRCGAVMVEALWEGGVPRDVLRIVQFDDPSLGERLVSSPLVDQVILTGGYETAERFRGFRPDLRLLGETSGKNAIVVTPSADIDLAVKDVVASAFGHAGQKCSAASLVILVGAAASSRRFREQLVDAVASLSVGWPEDPETRMGPVIAPAEGKLLDGLTALGEGESWLVEPRRLDDAGRLWSPGVRAGVRPGSAFHLTEYFGPVLGIMEAPTLSAAIELQNAVAYGLTAGIHSLDADEVREWIGAVQAGNLYVNRGITGAIVRRQPFGGWKRSVVGPGFKAGGPNYLIGLCTWSPAPLRTVGECPTDERVLRLLAAARSKVTGLGPEEVDGLAAATASDAHAMTLEFDVLRDVSGLHAERNVFRYLPHETEVRIAADARPAEAIRVIAAGLLSRARLSVSTEGQLPRPLADALRELGVPVATESPEEWGARAARAEAVRVRLVGGSGAELARAAGGRPDMAVFDGPVTASGRIELLPFLREQAVSITAHRFGTPSALAGAVL